MHESLYECFACALSLSTKVSWILHRLIFGHMASAPVTAVLRSFHIDFHLLTSDYEQSISVIKVL
jgi:hypothetical protein